MLRVELPPLPQVVRHAHLATWNRSLICIASPITRHFEGLQVTSYAAWVRRFEATRHAHRREVGGNARARAKVRDTAAAHKEEGVEEAIDVGARLVDRAQDGSSSVGERAQLTHEQQ